MGGYNFICSECGAFYCLNCANTLSDLENACWVCNSPFDPTKPSKPFDIEKNEDISVEEKDPKEKDQTVLTDGKNRLSITIKINFLLIFKIFMMSSLRLYLN